MSKYAEISTDVQDYFNFVFDKHTSLGMFNIKCELVSCDTQKNLIELKKNNDVYNYLLETEVVIIINEKVFDLLEEKQRELLFVECLHQLHFDSEKDKLNVVPADVVTYSPIIKKYGIDEYMQCQEVLATAIDQACPKPEPKGKPKNA
jgi:hypothetical protein